MGTTAEQPLPPLPWDVPVRLVLREKPRTRDVEQSATWPVDIGIELPGVRGVNATTSTVDGLMLLSAIRPAGRPAARPPSQSQRPIALRDLLAQLEVDGVVPVLVGGTPFTLTVLTALIGVAAGERCSYAELAARAGRARAVRAAAHVMATNLVPLVLPCHRVVPSGGGTGRYAWGDAVKKVLLDAESRTERGVEGRATV